MRFGLTAAREERASPTKTDEQHEADICANAPECSPVRGMASKQCLVNGVVAKRRSTIATAGNQEAVRPIVFTRFRSSECRTRSLSDSRSVVAKGPMSMTTKQTREVAFIDSKVDDLATLLTGLRRGVEPILLSAGERPARQMARVIAERQRLTAIHVIAHGVPGQLNFGTRALALETLEEDAQDLNKIGKALGPEGKLLLWSCDAGQGARGSAFVQGLVRLTGADVRAATGRVGSPVLGARWELDVAYGKGKEPVLPPLSAQGMARYLGILAGLQRDNQPVARLAPLASVTSVVTDAISRLGEFIDFEVAR